MQPKDYLADDDKQYSGGTYLSMPILSDYNLVQI